MDRGWNGLAQGGVEIELLNGDIDNNFGFNFQFGLNIYPSVSVELK